MGDHRPNKEILVIGCGNPLVGDDGFGPAVIACLEENYCLPGQVKIMDAGTSIREILFDLLLTPQKPDHLIIVDSVNFSGGTPGNIFRINLDQIPSHKISDYSLHQFPTQNLLKELREFSPMDLQFLAVQVDHIPEFVSQGLSKPVDSALLPMCDWILEEINGMVGIKGDDHADL